MRYQERIYVQNGNSCVRNRAILNVNMSSDMCVFESPLFSVNGASKLDCTGTTGTSYVVSTATTIPLTFQFTANTDTFLNSDASFKYEVYKYNTGINSFIIPPVYKSSNIQYSGFSASSATTQYVPISSLGLDGDYLIKGYYEFNACTDFLNRLGKKVDTLSYRAGSIYGLYDSNLDYYFIAVKQADIPQFLINASNNPSANALFQQVILPPAGINTVVVSDNVLGFFVLTLNGLVLSPNLDYTYSGNVITLSSSTVYDDIITIIYTTSGINTLIGDNIYVDKPVVSGITNNQGSNTTYFDTTTGKYEIYMSVTPASGSAILVMLNGATLASGIDYYPSTTNSKRIILEGDIRVGDVITIVYFPITSVVNGLLTYNPVITWGITNAPELVNGQFTLEVSTNSSFSTLFASAITPYIVGQTLYTGSFIASGKIGSKLYYRVKNEKDYVTLCGNIVTTIAYSEIIPLIIQTNSINSY
jgi:hypothetical protein